MKTCVEKEISLAFEEVIRPYEDLKLEENLREANLNDLLKVQLFFEFV